MRKIFFQLFKKTLKSKYAVPEKVKNVLSKKNACYVLIACSEPSDDGKMEVEMTYEGDATLAAYLLESAQGTIDDSAQETKHCT